MNIIILAKNYENYGSGYYHQDIINSFKKKANCYLYGEGYPQYNPYDNIDDVIFKSPFEKGDLDLIVVGTSWEIQDPTINESDPHPPINLDNSEVPAIFFLNKEYKKLDKKLEYIKKNNFDLVCTVHHDFKKWQEITGIKFIQIPFAADPERFMDYGFSKKYDFGFTGSLHTSYTDIRFNIKRIIFNNLNVKSNLGLSVIFRKNPLNEKYRKYNIYWAEWGARNLRGRSMLPTGIEYAKFLNSFKTFLSTPSAIGLVGTRFYECMGTKTIIFCPESGYYGNNFIDGHNCVMFRTDLSNFEEKFEYILSNAEERKKIINNAHNDFLSNHTYDHRIRNVLNTVFK